MHFGINSLHVIHEKENMVFGKFVDNLGKILNKEIINMLIKLLLYINKGKKLLKNAIKKCSRFFERTFYFFLRSNVNKDVVLFL